MDVGVEKGGDWENDGEDRDKWGYRQGERRAVEADDTRRANVSFSAVFNVPTEQASTGWFSLMDRERAKDR